MSTVFERILEFLKNRQISYRHIHHQPTYTCEESAKARSESLEIGAKALLMKVDDTYSLFVLSASKQLDSKKIKKFLSTRSLRFASAEELLEQTSLVPGSVPPFGKPIFPFQLYVDSSIGELSHIAFNAGSLSDSLVISSQDYLNSSNGIVCSFSK